MAEAALLGVANSVLSQLSSPALKKALLLWDFDKDLKKLSETIQTITAFLHDAEQRESKEQVVKLWLSRIRAILYDAEDLFDAIAARALRKKAMSGNAFKREVHLFFSKSNQLGFIYKTADNIKAIRERVDHIKNDMDLFSVPLLEVGENYPLMNLNRKTHSYVDVKNVIGRDEDQEKIISLLLSEKSGDRNLYVISIIGFGGLGKTTLAQLVYNDDRVQNGFDLCLWTCINYLSDLKSVLVTILTSALESKPQELDLDQLQKKLRESIGGKKILLVLDDVWEEDASNWHKLKPLLDWGKAGSTVLATTRNTKVAQCLESMKPYYQLDVLSEDHAWSLFEKVTFDDNESIRDHSELVPLGKEIVRKCGRVPLALVTIGRMLSYIEKDEHLWLSFIENELPDVLGDDTNNAKLIEVLKLSYNHLQPAFKHCLAYCSLYPKDHYFNKDELVRMWVAQGFLKPRGQKSLEEVGDECFFYMVGRCFFQELKEYRNNGVVTYRCKMHDLLHDLAIQVAGCESGCFMEGDLGDMVEGRTLRHISATQNPTFPAVQFSLSSHSKTLRTLLLNANELERSSLNSILSRFRVLRVLKLSKSQLDTLPDSFGGLIHLRYLDLSWNRNLKALPNSVCKLYNLQSLVLVDCKSLVGLPSKIGKLGSLRHLLLDGCRELEPFPLGFEALTALVTLHPLVVDQNNRGLTYLGCLDNLCGGIEIKLPVKGWSNWIEDLRNSNMSRKHKLNSMTIEWIRGSTDETSKEETQAALEELKPNENLQYLRIKGHVDDKLSSWVFSLSKLKELVLKDCTNLEYLEDNLRFDSLLPCLEILELESLPNLKGWWREVALPGDNGQISKLPSLSRVIKSVVIHSCPKLIESMPLFMGIETLNLSGVSGEFVSKLMSNPYTSCSSFEPHYYCCKLKKLDILFASGLRRVSADGLAYLTALERLSISNCGQVDIVDKDDEKVGANNVSEMPWKALRRLRCLKVSWQKHLLQDGLQYLTALEELEIEYYKTQQVEADNECGGIILWKDLKRLQTIDIDYAGVEDERIYSFPNWVQYLPSLKVLKLWSAKLLHIRWTILANMKLEELTFWDAEKVVNVDEMEGDQQPQFNSLLRLCFSFLKDGSWLHQLPWKLFPSLRILELFIVKNLRSIPNGIQHLTSLKELVIEWATPEIFQRCKAEVGEDWHLISHIPTIQIEWKDEDGNYQKIDVKPRTHRRS